MRNLLLVLIACLALSFFASSASAGHLRRHVRRHHAVRVYRPHHHAHRPYYGGTVVRVVPPRYYGGGVFVAGPGFRVAVGY